MTDHDLSVKIWAATHGVTLETNQRIALATMLRNNFIAGQRQRFKLNVPKGLCLRCQSTEDLIFCELKAFEAHGLFCKPCRDENWKILRENNER